MYIYVVVGHWNKYSTGKDISKNLEVTTDNNIFFDSKPENYPDDVDYITVEIWKDGKLDKVSPKVEKEQMK